MASLFIQGRIDGFDLNVHLSDGLSVCLSLTLPEATSERNICTRKKVRDLLIDVIGDVSAVLLQLPELVSRLLVVLPAQPRSGPGMGSRTQQRSEEQSDK